MSAKARFLIGGDTTLRLINVVPTASHTVVELMIEDPAITGAKSAAQRLYAPLRESDLHLEGFADQTIRSYAIRPALGCEHHILELAPLIEQDAAVVFEVITLLKRQPDGTFEPVPGPWRFEFQPQVPAEQIRSRRILLKQVVRTDEVEIRLEEMLLSADQTVLYYRLGEPPERTVFPETPLLRWDEQEVWGSGGVPGADGRWEATFPPLPPDVRQVALVFPPLPYARIGRSPSASPCLKCERVRLCL